MMIRTLLLSALIFALPWTPVSANDESAPWGVAKPAAETVYAPQKVVFDVALDSPEDFEVLMDRMSGLSYEYNADPFGDSIVAVFKGPDMHFLTTGNFRQYGEQVR